MTSIGDHGRRSLRSAGNGAGVQSDAFQKATNEEDYLQVVGKTPEDIALRRANSSAITRVPRKKASDYLLSCETDDFVHGANIWKVPANTPSRGNRDRNDR